MALTNLYLALTPIKSTTYFYMYIFKRISILKFKISIGRIDSQLLLNCCLSFSFKYGVINVKVYFWTYNHNNKKFALS